jgi:alginate O-acetyltransferase complex protein AlgI
VLFNSVGFIAFLMVSVLGFHFFAGRGSWLYLLVASLAFYASFMQPFSLVVFAGLVLVTHGCGRMLWRTSRPSGKLFWLWVGIGINLMSLVVLKYLVPLGVLHTAVVLSVMGLSYYVFQAIAYLCDLYFGTLQHESHLGWFAVHMAFFPKMIQGPIERGGELIPQLRAPYAFNYQNMREGALLFFWGLFKKAVIADRLSPFVDRIFNAPENHSGPALAAAACLFSLQLFADFSGYTDMALGCARLFNIRLTQNFDAPFLATSMKDFWRRWHISLSKWILDYVFQPLQVTFRYWGVWGMALALFLSFLAMGLWHGATTGFVIYGLVQGTYMAAAVFYKPIQKKLHSKLGIQKTLLLKVWQICFTFCLVTFSFIFFRSANLGQAWQVVKGLGKGWLQAGLGLSPLLGDAKDRMDAWVLLAAILCLLCVLVLKEKIIFWKRPALFRWGVYSLLVLSVFALGKFFSNKQFIYSQF